MATKKETKTTKKKTPKKTVAIYKGQEYEVLEKGNGVVILTDGLIHFGAREKNVTFK